jgi:uncharacterized membrane protein
MNCQVNWRLWFGFEESRIAKFSGRFTMMIGTIGFGWLMMVIMIGLPILAVILILMAAAGFFQNGSFSIAPIRDEQQGNRPTDSSSSVSTARYCVHCGAGLLSEWTHCPQCGAPV